MQIDFRVGFLIVKGYFVFFGIFRDLVVCVVVSGLVYDTSKDCDPC